MLNWEMLLKVLLVVAALVFFLWIYMKFKINKVLARCDGSSERTISGGGRTSISVSPNMYGSGYSGSVYRDSGWVDTLRYKNFTTVRGSVSFNVKNAVSGGLPSCDYEGKYGVLKYNSRHFSFKLAENQEAAKKEFDEKREKHTKREDIRDSVIPYLWVIYNILLIGFVVFCSSEYVDTTAGGITWLVSLIAHPVVVWKRNWFLVDWEEKYILPTILSVVDIIELVFLPLIISATPNTITHAALGLIPSIIIVVIKVVEMVRERLWK